MLLLSRFGMSKAGKAIVSLGPTGPGPTTLAYGDSTMGFFGEVLASDFINGTNLSVAVGMTSGNLITSYDNDPWLKFILDGKILFIPKRFHRNNVSWTSIYQAGAVYGDNTFGSFPSGANRLQDASVIIGSNKFTVRLLTGATGDDAGNITGNNPDIAQGSEFNRLFYPLSKSAIINYAGPLWNLYDVNALGFSGSSAWTKEKHSYGATYRVTRGKNNLAIFNRQGYGGGFNEFVWKPCLELQIA